MKTVGRVLQAKVSVDGDRGCRCRRGNYRHVRVVLTVPSRTVKGVNARSKDNSIADVDRRVEETARAAGGHIRMNTDREGVAGIRRDD